MLRTAIKITKYLIRDECGIPLDKNIGSTYDDEQKRRGHVMDEGYDMPMRRRGSLNDTKREHGGENDETIFKMDSPRN